MVGNTYLSEQKECLGDRGKTKDASAALAEWLHSEPSTRDKRYL